MAQQKPKKVVLDISDIIKNAEGKVKESMVEQMLERLGESLRWRLNDFMSDQVDEFLKEEIGPDIKNHLLDYRQDIIDEIGKSMKTVAKEFGSKLTEKALEKISKMDGYDFGKIVKEIF